MNLVNKIYALSLRHIYLIRGSFPRIIRFNLLANYSNFSLGFLSQNFLH